MIKTKVGFGILLPLVVLLGVLMFVNSLFLASFKVKSSEKIFFVVGFFLMSYFLFKTLKDILLTCRFIRINRDKNVYIFNKSIGKINKVTEFRQYSKLGNSLVLIIECDEKSIKIPQFYYRNYYPIKEFLKKELMIEIIK